MRGVPLPEQLARLRFALQVARNLRRDNSVPPSNAFARFGRASVIVPPARITNPQWIAIGDEVVLHEGAWLSVVRAGPEAEAPYLEIGDRTRIGRFAHIACAGEVRIGPEVLAADMVFIGDTHHGFADPQAPIARQPLAPPRPVVIERGAFLGIRATVLEGVTVGENAYVAAGAVVVDDVPARTVVAGNPARPVRRWDPDARAWVRSG